MNILQQSGTSRTESTSSSNDISQSQETGLQQSEEAEDEKDSGEADDVGDEEDVNEEEGSDESPEVKDEGDVDEEDGPEESPEIKDEADLSDNIEQEDDEASQQQRDSQLPKRDWQVWEDQTIIGRRDEGLNYTSISLQLYTRTTEECKARHVVLKKVRIPWIDLGTKLLADVVKSRIPQPKGPRDPPWREIATNFQCRSAGACQAKWKSIRPPEIWGRKKNGRLRHLK